MMVAIPQIFRAPAIASDAASARRWPHLQGKVAFVSGGARGIGAAIATRLAEDGADIAVTYVSNDRSAEELVDRIRAIGRRATAFKANSSDAASFRQAIEQSHATLGRLDILVNNAGFVKPGMIDDYSVDEFDLTFYTNVRAAFISIQAAAKLMGRGGRIINIGSAVGKSYPPAVIGSAAYSMSKGALINLTKAAAREFGPRGITVNIILPGPTATEGLSAAPLEFFEMSMAQCAIKEFAEPFEVGALVSFLASEEARHITGSDYAIDSGFSI
jgi:3-oxoacyl-[acyl-carrier protein] reductase